MIQIKQLLGHSHERPNSLDTVGYRLFFRVLLRVFQWSFSVVLFLIAIYDYIRTSQQYNVSAIFLFENVVTPVFLAALVWPQAFAKYVFCSYLLIKEVISFDDAASTIKARLLCVIPFDSKQSYHLLIVRDSFWQSGLISHCHRLPILRILFDRVASNSKFTHIVQDSFWQSGLN